MTVPHRRLIPRAAEAVGAEEGSLALAMLLPVAADRLLVVHRAWVACSLAACPSSSPVVGLVRPSILA